jgi:Rrf2 family protein
MDISLRSQYALRALVLLAMKRGEGVISGRQIADFGGIPGKYVEQVMHDLRQAGLVRSRRGKGGGYVLGREPEAITILGVVETIEGSLYGFGRMRSGDPVGPLLEPVWHEVRMSLKDILGSASIAGVAERAAADMYHI